MVDVYRKTTHTNDYLQYNNNNPNYQKDLLPHLYFGDPFKSLLKNIDLTHKKNPVECKNATDTRMYS